MSRLAREWVAKAEDDYDVARTLLRRKRIVADIVCSPNSACKYARSTLLNNYRASY
jgi:hypothetical protein